MNESKSKPEKPQKEQRYNPELLKKGLRCDLDQYEMLLRCSEEESITEWNEWREQEQNTQKDVLLEGAEFLGSYLKKADFRGPTCYDDSGNPNRGEVYLKKAEFEVADLEETDFQFAHLENAILRHANLKNTNLSNTHLEGTVFQFALLEDACLSDSHLQSAKFQRAKVNGSTSLWECKVNRYCKNDEFTDFSGVALDDLRIDPATKQLLEYNIRRMNWEVWYDDENEPIRDGIFIFSNKKIRLKTNKILTWLVRKFWQISNYGISTIGIIKTFFKWAFVFAIVYYAWGLVDYYLLCNKDYPGIVSNLFVLDDSKEAVSGWLVPIRAIYFSIVTMTTLGFGDMYANAHSLFRGIFGHILLALQVILGYVLMGALVTRFAVLFTAGGPAGKFADEKEDKK